MTESGNEKRPKVYQPTRLREDQVERLEREKVRRGFETLAPVTRLAVDRGLDALEREQI